jgi:nicotinamide-nucleotide amidase
VRCEVLAIGTELLLGQVVDTNSSWIGEQLALAGIDCNIQTKVGDNHDRIVAALRDALARADAVIVCGGLGPTQDDITREAIAEVMGVALVRDEAVVDRIRSMFSARGREMAVNNLHQADVPAGAMVLSQVGTAPGLSCPVGEKVVYAVPGVPYEMKEIIERDVVPDLKARSGEQAVIVSRLLRTWGVAESTLAEIVAPRLDALDAVASAGDGARVTYAFLASGWEGIKLRLTAKAATPDEARALIEAEDGEVRNLLGTRVFGVDDDTMESAVGVLLEAHGLTLAVAESMTGGLVASRVVDAPGSSEWFRGGVVAYDSEVKFDVLGVRRGPVVDPECAQQMAEGVRRVLKADVGLSVTGVAGPAEQEGQPVGTAYFGIALGDSITSMQMKLGGDRTRSRQFACISLLDQLRHRLLELPV